jgi:hypothetical protein
LRTAGKRSTQARQPDPSALRDVLLCAAVVFVPLRWHRWCG